MHLLHWKKILPIDIFVDAVPDESEAELQEHLLAEIIANGGRKAETLVELFVPQRLAIFILKSARVDALKKCHQLKEGGTDGNCSDAEKLEYRPCERNSS